jgi:hypothetical protein
MEQAANLQQLGERAKEFVCKPDPVYAYNGKSVDLRKIDARLAEHLANDPRCRFIQWADPKKRHKDQLQPLPAGAGFTDKPATGDTAGEGDATATAGRRSGRS